MAEASYARRRIEAKPSPLKAEAIRAHEAMIAVASKMIRELEPTQFEILVDLIFAQSGWRREGRLGGVQADTDMTLVQKATGERAFVQVKSKADRATFERYVQIYRASPGFTRMFFVCHTTVGDWSAPDSSVVVWNDHMVAEQVVEVGLFVWLSARVA